MRQAATGKGRSSNLVGTDWRQASLEGSALILSVVKEAASLSPLAELKKAACVTLTIMQIIQALKENREAYERLGDDSCGLIVAIWRSYKSAEVPGEWLSAEMREILEDLTDTLESIRSFVMEQLSRNKMIRVVFSRADGIKINEYREHLNFAMQKFELQSHININDVLLQMMRKNDQLSEQILHRNEEEDITRFLESLTPDTRDLQVEIDPQAVYGLHLYPWKEIAQRKEDRRSELERLRAAASEIERRRAEERWREAEEHWMEAKEKLAQLKRKIAAEERTNLPMQAQSRKNPLKSPKRSPVIADISTDDDDDDLQSLRSSKLRAGRRKLSNPSLCDEDLPFWKKSSNLRPGPGNRSNASLRVEGTDEDTDEEEDYSSRQRVRRKHQRLPGSCPIDANGLMARLTPLGLGDNLHWTESGMYSYSPPHYVQSLRRLKPSEGHWKLSNPSLFDEDLPFWKKSSNPPGPGNRSNASLRVEGRDEDTDEEGDYFSRQRVRRKHQSSPGRRPIDVNGLMARLTPLGLGGGPHWNESAMYSYPHFAPPGGPYYGYPMGPPGTVINSGVGNITNTTISNVGNKDSLVAHDAVQPGRDPSAPDILQFIRYSTNLPPGATAPCFLLLSLFISLSYLSSTYFTFTLLGSIHGPCTTEP